MCIRDRKKEEIPEIVYADDVLTKNQKQQLQELMASEEYKQTVRNAALHAESSQRTQTLARAFEREVAQLAAEEEKKRVKPPKIEQEAFEKAQRDGTIRATVIYVTGYANSAPAVLGGDGVRLRRKERQQEAPVSYTHLTLPTTPYV